MKTHRIRIKDSAMAYNNKFDFMHDIMTWFDPYCKFHFIYWGYDLRGYYVDARNN